MSDNNSEPTIPEMPTKAPALRNDQRIPGGDSQELSKPVSKPKSRWSRKQKPGPEQGLPGVDATTLAGGKPDDRDGHPRRRKLRWYWVAGVAVLLMAAGVVAGTMLPDPRNSKEYGALQSQKDGLTADLGKLQARYDTLDAGIRGRESKIRDRETAAAGTEAAVKAADAAVKAADAGVKAAEAAVKKREDAVSGAEKQKAASMIREGTWTVGVDIEPGTYRTSADVASGCYWGIYRTGSNGSDIIDNDIVTGGRPTVTLSPGQDFKTSRCGSWSKQ
jgi:hypothetical protein